MRARRSEDGKPARLVAALRRAAIDYMRAHVERFRFCGEGAVRSSGGSEPSATPSPSQSSPSQSSASQTFPPLLARRARGHAKSSQLVVGPVCSQDGNCEEGWDAYCAAMADMSQARYGGHPELVALSESLRVRVDIHDTGALSGRMATYHLGEHLPETCPTVRGLRRGPHFDLLLSEAEPHP